MRAVFIELPAFERHREHYFDDEGFARLQITLMAHPSAGELIVGAGGLRKLRYADPRRGKGKRGGLSARQRASLKQLVKTELIMRRKT